MEIINLLFKILIGITTVFVTLKILYPEEKFIHILDALMHVLMFHTLFYNYFVFINFLRLILALLFAGVYYEFTWNTQGGIIYTLLFLFLLFQIIRSHMKGSLNFKKDFEYQKYNAPTHVFRIIWKDERIRRKAYNSLLQQMQSVTYNQNSSIDSKLYIERQFLFEDFNSIINSSKSTKSTGQLIFFEFKKSYFQLLNQLKKDAYNEKSVFKTFETLNVLKFNDSQGLTINSESVLRDFENRSHKEELKKLDGIIINLEKQIKLIYEKRNDKNIKTLVHEFTQGDLIEILTTALILKDIEITYKIKTAIRNFVYKNFKNMKGKNGKYVLHKNNMELLNHLDLLNNTLVNNMEKLNCTKKDIADILEEYFKSFKSTKTIQNL